MLQKACFIHMQIQFHSIVAVMRCSHVKSLLFSTFFISFSLVIIDCSTCEQKHNKSIPNDVNRTGIFQNLSGDALEEAVVDEIAKQSEIHSRIHLRHLGISRVTKNMLKNISSIHSIDFQCNEITEIENGSFSSNEKLEKIDLMANHLTKITKYVFSGDFHELQEINLSFNDIISIESGSFDKFVNLATIDISNNCIRHLHSDLFKKCSELRQVFLSHNEIINIKENIFRMKVQLIMLDLSYNKLEYIPKFEIKSIKHLDMSNNNLTKLDLNYEASHEGKNLAYVEGLSVAHNSINKCVEMSEMRNDIIRLDVSHNQINDLNNFPVLVNMEVLQVSHNNISSLRLHKFRETFPSLKAINISENIVECDEYHYLHKKIARIAIFINLNCSLSRDIDSQMDALYSQNEEIVRQLELNRYFLIALLSIFAIIMIFPMAFLLLYYLQNNRVKNMLDENLIEQIEL